MTKDDENQIAGESAVRQPLHDDAGEEISELKAKLELMSKERDEYLNGWRRTKADLTNYKNDELKRLEEVIKFGNADIFKDIIPILNNLDLAVAALVRAGKKDVGIEIIRNQLEEALLKRGLQKIVVQIGEQFNPATEEVLSDEASDAAPGSVLEVLEQGYVLNGKVLKPARVKISKPPQHNEDNSLA